MPKKRYIGPYKNIQITTQKGVGYPVVISMGEVVFPMTLQEVRALRRVLKKAVQQAEGGLF